MGEHIRGEKTDLAKLALDISPEDVEGESRVGYQF